MLLRCLHVASCWRKGLESRVSPDRVGFGLGLVLRMWERMRSGMYLALIVRATNWHRRRCVGRVGIMLINDYRMVFTALLSQWGGNTVTAARILG